MPSFCEIMRGSPRSFANGTPLDADELLSVVCSLLITSKQRTPKAINDLVHTPTAAFTRYNHLRNNNRIMFPRSSSNQTVSGNATGATSRRAFRVSFQHAAATRMRRPCLSCTSCALFGAPGDPPESLEDCFRTFSCNRIDCGSIGWGLGSGSRFSVYPSRRLVFSNGFRTDGRWTAA